MGNRAVITTSQKKIGLYLHWNGGRDSIEAFLKYCELQGFIPPEKDCYGWARLSQVISNFFGGSLSIGIDEYYKLDRDNFDNGVYIIKDWQIIGREHFEGPEQREHSLDLMLKAIDKKQPKHMQLGEFLDAEEVKVEDIRLDDIVFMYDYDRYVKYKVVGFGEDRIINGHNVDGIPFVDKYLNDNSYSNNINNYILTPIIRKLNNA